MVMGVVLVVLGVALVVLEVVLQLLRLQLLLLQLRVLLKLGATLKQKQSVALPKSYSIFNKTVSFLVKFCVLGVGQY